MVHLYQRVQYVSNVLPRLYLMCTVGAVFIVSDKQSAREVLKDMLEMLHGVQHPTRGLFLRHYLNQATKNKLSALGDALARCEFCLQNFDEMTQLWVRMQHQSSGNKDPETRETERRQLKQLVGSNLVRISEEMEDDDVETYAQSVLPRILKIVETSQDAFAQTYLLEITTQVIPNDFQVRPSFFDR
jgi:vacuolar protein sorting-associated protein 35